MDAVEQLQDDLREGCIAPLRLIELLLASQRQLHEAHQRIAELEKQLAGFSTPKVDQPSSLRAEEKRQDARRKKKRKPPRPGLRGRGKRGESWWEMRSLRYSLE